MRETEEKQKVETFREREIYIQCIYQWFVRALVYLQLYCLVHLIIIHCNSKYTVILI
jgi:hypothetical protein